MRKSSKSLQSQIYPSHKNHSKIRSIQHKNQRNQRNFKPQKRLTLLNLNKVR